MTTLGTFSDHFRLLHPICFLIFSEKLGNALESKPGNSGTPRYKKSQKELKNAKNPFLGVSRPWWKFALRTKFKNNLLNLQFKSAHQK